MGKLGYLFLAYALVWSALFVFLLNTAKKITAVKRELAALRKHDPSKK